MANELFRKKSLEKIQSPESLNDCIRVANPGVWLLLIAVVTLLIGACLWGIFGRIESKVDAKAVVSDGKVTLYVPAAQNEKIPADFLTGKEQKVFLRIDGKRYDCTVTVTHDSHTLETGDTAFLASSDLADGDYNAELVLESIRPFSFIWN